MTTSLSLVREGIPEQGSLEPHPEKDVIEK